MRDRAWWERHRHAWSIAMRNVAEVNSSPVVKAGLGSIAWGRFEGEPRPSEKKDDVVFGCGFLEGVRYALLMVARDRQLDESGLVDVHRTVDQVKRKAGGGS